MQDTLTLSLKYEDLQLFKNKSNQYKHKVAKRYKVPLQLLVLAGGGSAPAIGENNKEEKVE